jgi:7-cyano-7-deazaguanine synthase
MSKAFVLLSGGIDSTTCLAIAMKEFNGNVEAVSVNYGQRHQKETTYALNTCAHLNVPHHILDLRGIIPKTMLTDVQAALPNMSYDEIQGVSPTYVPFRNGLMLSALTSFVHGQFTKTSTEEWGIYFGAHSEDARNWAYPDCTPEFIGSMANAIYIGTYRQVRLHTPLQWMTKAEIIITGDMLGVNWEDTWSCYGGGALHCGTCPTCRARKAGFIAAKVKDPTQYAK